MRRDPPTNGVSVTKVPEAQSDALGPELQNKLWILEQTFIGAFGVAETKAPVALRSWASSTRAALFSNRAFGHLRLEQLGAKHGRWVIGRS